MKVKFFYLLLTLFFINTYNFADEYLEPYQSIRDLPFDNHGWFFNGNYIESFITYRNVKTVIEVGSWMGLSTRFIAQRIPKGGKVYAIDTWLGSNEPAHTQDPRLKQLYQIFLSNVKHAGLTDKIIPIRMTSLEAANALNVMADLIYIDASHETVDVYNDIIAWNKHLKPNGTMCGDDWLWDSVKAGVIQAANVLNKKVNHIETFWWFE